MKKPTHKLPKRYEPLPLDQYVTRAKTLYSKGEIMEAFLILYSTIEHMLLNVWASYVMQMTATRQYRIPREGWQYSELVKLLHDLKLINDSERSILLDFKKGRNEVVHILGTEFNRKVTVQNLNHRFKNGVKSFAILHKLLSHNYSIDILKIRLAEGEITQEEFGSLKKDYE